MLNTSPINILGFGLVVHQVLLIMTLQSRDKERESDKILKSCITLNWPSIESSTHPYHQLCPTSISHATLNNNIDTVTILILLFISILKGEYRDVKVC